MRRVKSDAGLAALIAVALMGCTQRRDSGPRESHGDSQSATLGADSVPLRRFAEPVAAVYRHNSGVRDSMLAVVRDTAGWEDMWRRLTARHSPVPLPAIDFGKEMAVVVALGQRSHGGYAIRIEAVIDRGTYLEAHVQRRAPGRGCGVTGALTTPADVVVIPRREGEVRMVAHDDVAQCGAR